MRAGLMLEVKAALLVLGGIVSTAASLLAQAPAPETNAITAAIQVEKAVILNHPEHLVKLSLRLSFDNETNIERSSILTFTYEGTNFYAALSNGTGVIHDPSPNWMYFMATNSFAGPMELRDATGKVVPPRKPEINEARSYPAQYALSRLWALTRRQWAFPRVLLPREGTVANMPEFALEDYFNLTDPGNYVLTVWPRIYRREAKGADICHRIDVPPVTVSVHWP